MDLQKNLFGANGPRQKGGWKASLVSAALHGALIASIVILGASTTHKVDAEDKPIRAFVTQGAAPPPPPPPPPPAPALSSSAPKATPRIQVEPKPVPHDAFIPPRETPKEVPVVETPSAVVPQEDAPASTVPDTPPSGAVEGGVPGGVAGGVVGGEQGGVVGGEIGGVKGGELGGEKGGEIGGVLGGKVGGTGTGTEGEGSGGNDAPVTPPSGPVRVGGNVKAPTVTDRTKPEYTELARKARVSGVVIIEAIIDRNGNVDRVRVIKGLPMGLSGAAEEAVRHWKFKPGTMNGVPVDVIFNLTVNFTLGQ